MPRSHPLEILENLAKAAVRLRQSGLLKDLKLADGVDAAVRAMQEEAKRPFGSDPSGGDHPAIWLRKSQSFGSSRPDEFTDDEGLVESWVGHPNTTAVIRYEACTKDDEGPDASASERDVKWRDLALQFDGHRMQAMQMLQAVLRDPEGFRKDAEAFVAAPPLSGDAVLAERIEVMASKRQSISPAQAELDDIRRMLEEGQGDDDGDRILPVFEDDDSVVTMVSRLTWLLELRRDVIEAYGAGRREDDPSREVVRVASLEWNPLGGGSHVTAGAARGLYRVHRAVADGGDRVFFYFESVLGNATNEFSSLEEAKAAVQDHFEHWLCSVLPMSVEGPSAWKCVELASSEASVVFDGAIAESRRLQCQDGLPVWLVEELYASPPLDTQKEAAKWRKAYRTTYPKVEEYSLRLARERLSHARRVEELEESVAKIGAALEDARRRNDRFLAALTPSGETKFDLSGEFWEEIDVPNPEYDDSGEGDVESRKRHVRIRVPVQWTTVKAIMAAIRSHATSQEEAS